MFTDRNPDFFKKKKCIKVEMSVNLKLHLLQLVCVTLIRISFSNKEEESGKRFSFVYLLFSARDGMGEGCWLVTCLVDVSKRTYALL